MEGLSRCICIHIRANVYIDGNLFRNNNRRIFKFSYAFRSIRYCIKIEYRVKIKKLNLIEETKGDVRGVRGCIALMLRNNTKID